MREFFQELTTWELKTWHMRTNKIKNEMYKIKKWQDKIKRKDLKYETKIYIFDFQQCEIIRSFGENISIHKASIIEGEEDQYNLLKT